VLLKTQIDAFPRSMTWKLIKLSHLEGHLNSLIALQGGEEASRGVTSEDTQVYPSLT